MPDDELDDLIEDYRTWIHGGYPPAEAAARLLRHCGDPEVVQRVVDEDQRRSRRYMAHGAPDVLKGDRHIETWYQGPDHPGAWCWPAYRELLPRKGWTSADIEGLDGASTRIMAHLPHPGQGQFRTRGLVVGHVQSGKTANYTALISKAADAGYKLFIVLTGMTTSLRQQTQERLDAEICNLNSEYWNALTTRQEDFRGHGNPDFLLSPHHRRGRILCVVKKNVHILNRLNSFLGAANPDVLRQCPVVVIDDEADQASINTRQKADGRSAINRKVVDLLQLLPKSVYIGYTATPFANIFIDPTLPEDLYPRDFVLDIPPSDGYLGAERMLGRDLVAHDVEGAQFDGLDMIRDVVEADVGQLQPPTRTARFEFTPRVPRSLDVAMQYFLLATACRFVRGQTGADSSMLVHTTLYTHTHGQLESVVNEHVEEFQARWARRDPALLEGLKRLWVEESPRVVTGLVQVSFDQLLTQMPTVLSRLQVAVDNGMAETRLRYVEGDPRVYIVIGGNTLSRGLTLEGLVVSYFIRTASAYDTLLQMGRWFGYRRGYDDLPRVWMTAELQNDFIHLAGVEAEIRHDLRRYVAEGKTPLDFAVRVQTHPKLSITSRLKMQNVELAAASYGDTHIQTIQFHHDDRRWLEANLRATRRLLGECTRFDRTEPDPHRWLVEGVDTTLVLRFFEEYEAIQEDFRKDLLRPYIEAERDAGGLRSWNIGIIGSGNGAPVDLGLAGAETRMVQRSRFGSIEPANIKALTGSRDRAIDLALGSGDSPPRHQDLPGIRNLQRPDTGLLLIYAIDPESHPGVQAQAPGRRPLGATGVVVGIGISFPASRRGMREYIQNNLDGVFEGAVLDPTLEDEADVELIAAGQSESEG